MAALAGTLSPWRFVSVDQQFLAPNHALISSLRRQLVHEALPALDTAYSADFMASLLQTAVVHLRDELVRGRRTGPALVDSYYYKILAKCRLAGSAENPMFGWWRSFPQPTRVFYVEVSPATAWRRCAAGAKLNRLEHYGERPDWPGFEAFQTDLDKQLLDEVRHLPVTVIPEHDGVDRMVNAIRKELMREYP